tara:strand:- start:1234 stop:1722 length:489 start_codon:yes stop_codon:yes gene_type:complete
MYLKKIRLIKKLCNDKESKISLAESCTGGLLSSLLTQIPGSSEFFESSYIVYSNKSKINSLGVSPSILKKYGAVSKNTSLHMAKSLYKKTKTNIVLSITGVAGPDGGTKKNPVGTVFFTIGLKDKQKILYKTFHKKFKNIGRRNIQQKSALFAVDQIIKIIS